jgi:pyridoxine 5-phosphate synthase
LILIKKIIKRLKKSKIRVSLFIEPNIKDIKIAKKINADCVEIHVGKFCILHNKKKNTKKEFEKIKKSIHFANEIGLEAHAGHGITFSSAKILSRIKGIKEFNIGHFLIAESIFIGMKKCIKIFKKILKKKFILILKLKTVKRKKTRLSVTQNDLLPKRLFSRQLVLEINCNLKI